MNAYRRLLKWLRSPDPHFRKLEELARVTSPEGKRDAVLIRFGAKTASLRVVKCGEQAYGYDTLATFIHCSELAMDWQGESVVIRGECQDFTAKCEVKKAAGSYTLKIK